MPPSGPPICSALISWPSSSPPPRPWQISRERGSEPDLVDAGIDEALVETDQLGARRGAGAQRGVGLRAVLGDERCAAQRLDVVDDRRKLVVALLRRERRASRDDSAEALERVEQRRLLADDVGTGTFLHGDSEREPAAVDVVAEVAALVGPADRLAQGGRRARVLGAHVDEAVRRPHGVPRERQALDEEAGIALHQVLVDVGARIALVPVDDDELVLTWRVAGELPLDPGREAGAAAATQVGRLDLGQVGLRRQLGERAAQAAERARER